jgi:seryl-tRNA synthetase
MVCAVPPCFRKEIGSRGVDIKGLFRMHQFNKVEQVVVSNEKDSFIHLDKKQEISEDFFKSLKIPFRVIEICSGDLGAKFAKQYDIEAYFPRQKDYQEVTSAGNVTNYQAVSLNIKYIDNGIKKYCHMLNNTMVATSRAMVAIIENFQNKDGSINVPKVLIKYMGRKKKIHPT